MSAALRLSWAAADICAGQQRIQFRNDLVDVLLFVIQLDLNLLNCAARVAEFENDGDHDDALVSWQGFLLSFITDAALPILSEWLTQAETASAHGYVVNFAAYVALCVNLRDYISQTSFLKSWIKTHIG